MNHCGAIPLAAPNRNDGENPYLRIGKRITKPLLGLYIYEEEWKMMWKKGLAILFLVSLVASVSALEVTQIYEVDGIPFLRPFSIFLEKSVFVQGELARATEFQSINENCDNLSALFFLKDSSGAIIDQVNKNFGQSGLFTALFETQQDTTNLEVGTYAFETSWFCTIVGTTTELGQDGFIAPPAEPSRIEFQVISGDVPPPPPVCSRQCDVGYELINPDSADCFCSPVWDGNDGECELGEPVITPDCIAELECPSGQVLDDGVCVTPSIPIILNIDIVMIVLGIAIIAAVWFIFFGRRK